jgi:two-component system LytT family sensor kinase
VVKKGQLELTVSDNGPGVQLVDGNFPGPCGIGLRNTQQRLETLYGKAQSFVLEHAVPHGLRIVMRLPYQKG